jgi:hypothetical protein
MATNPYLVQFHEDLRTRYPVDGAEMSYSNWVAANTKIANRPFGFEGREFQRAILDDMSPDLTVVKPSQVGLTEVQVRKFLAILARNRGTSGIFTFPNEKMFKSNSKTRIKPVVSQPCFKSTGLEEDKPHRAMNLYEINGSFAHITGMTEGDATSTPADFLMHDELDLSDQAMIGLFQSRLQNSEWRHTEKFSTPTHAGYGIDAAYNASDQFEYMTRCAACNHWQVPVFDLKFLCLPGYSGSEDLENIDIDQVAKLDLPGCYVKCERCEARLDLKDPKYREWVARYPGRVARGYRIRPFSFHRLTPEYILRQLLKMRALDNLRGWKNTVLGETHSDGDSKLEPDQVRQVLGAPTVEIGSLTPLALGCDMGRTCHLTLGVIGSDRLDPVHFEQIPAADVVARIVQLVGQYNIVCGAVDRHPYTPTSEQIRDQTKGKILPIEYRGTEHVNIKKDEYDNIDFVQINRTRAIDEQVRAIQRKATTLSGFGGLESVVVEQLCDMVRIEVPDKPANWEKLTGNDHFLHSLTLQRASVKVREVVMMQNTSTEKFFFGLIPVGASTLSGPRNLY